jgi:hypothetical protein
MKYTFKTDARVSEKVVIDRALLTGKIKVYIDNKPVGPSHQGRRGAAGTFYPLKFGTLEVRSSLFEVVPSVWHNENWVELVPPMKGWQYLLVMLPLLSTIVMTFGNFFGLLIGALAVLVSYIQMRSQHSANVRNLLSVAIAIIAPIIALALVFVLSGGMSIMSK